MLHDTRCRLMVNSCRAVCSLVTTVASGCFQDTVNGFIGLLQLDLNPHCENRRTVLRGSRLAHHQYREGVSPPQTP